ncbi:MRN complex-interacting protein isoform X5 [Sapajus apella]|uniref:MRN complex-interacting protein isoform X5 n=1 Tax=Sapajus apella TaxID=9515 RepID=A0A6J3H7F5_SAPAP|nr:MRN complex-interacting protein isoform X5 [Sapajus apella]
MRGGAGDWRNPSAYVGRGRDWPSAECARARRPTTQARMAPPQHFRVLRCCSCRLFQAHQVKKNVKWTCKACGEKQSFLRAYGEGSGADCRRHVQKLNLLQGQVSELPLRSLEETVSASEEENMGHQQAGNVKQQEKSQPSGSRWLKYLEKDSQELELEGGGVCFSKQPSSKIEEPGPHFSQDLPRKRKWSQSTIQPPCSLGIQDSDGSEVAWEPQKPTPSSGLYPLFPLMPLVSHEGNSRPKDIVTPWSNKGWPAGVF